MTTDAAEPAIQIFDEALGRAPGRERLAGRKILMVGAGQRAVDAATDPVGNGRAIFDVGGAGGADVACADVNLESAAETVEIVAGEGGKAHAIAADISRRSDEIGRMVEEAAEAQGGLDGLVASAGACPSAASRRRAGHELGINLRGHVLTCQAALPALPMAARSC